MSYNCFKLYIVILRNRDFLLLGHAECWESVLYDELYFSGMDVILKLLNFGALKSLKTALGETAHDIAARKGRPSEVLQQLEVPQNVIDNREAIENIEEAVHKIIEDRVGDKIKETGIQLPQMSVLWEMSNECGKF